MLCFLQINKWISVFSNTYYVSNNREFEKVRKSKTVSKWNLFLLFKHLRLQNCCNVEQNLVWIIPSSQLQKPHVVEGQLLSIVHIVIACNISHFLSALKYNSVSFYVQCFIREMYWMNYSKLKI